MVASLRSRLWLTYLLLVVVVIGAAALALAVYLLRNPASDRRELQRLRLVSNVIQQRRRFFDNGNSFGGAAPVDRLENIAGRLDSTFDVRVAVFAPDGALLIDSRQATAAALPPLAQLNRPVAARRGVFRDATGRQWLYVSSPQEGGQVLVVSQQRPRLPVLTILRDEFLQPSLRALVFALALSLLLAILMARWIAAPLQRLAAAVRRASTGEFQPIPPEDGPREVREVARAFNDLATSLETSQRAQRDLIANVSHDLKTPLTSVQGFAQALLDGAAEDPQAARAFAEVIYAEAGRMHRMVLDLLDLARFDAGTLSFERRPLDLAVLLAGVMQKFAPQARQAQVDLRLEAAPPAGAVGLPVVGDADRLAQAFSNLIDNALKFTPANGQVRVLADSNDGWVEVSVADTGPGIPPDELERIFERFYQTDKSRSGSRRGAGLGLAIAREIARAHSGELSAHSRTQPASIAGIADPTVAGSSPINAGGNSSGCVFIVRLPLALPDDEPLSHHRQEPHALNHPAS